MIAGLIAIALQTLSESKIVECKLAFHLMILFVLTV